MKFPKGSNMKTPFLWNPFKKTTTTKSRVFPQTPGVHVFPWECLLNREAPTDVIPSPEKLGPDPKSSTFDKVGPEPILVKWSEMGPLLVTGRRRPILKDVLQKTQTRKRGINVLYIIIYIYINSCLFFCASSGGTPWLDSMLFEKSSTNFYSQIVVWMVMNPMVQSRLPVASALKSMNRNSY